MNPLVQHVGWMLVHSVWEDILVWCALRVSLIALARKSPQARYLAACLALVAMVGLPWLTFGATDLSARMQESHPVISDKVAAVPPLPAASHAGFANGNSQSETAPVARTFVLPQAPAGLLAHWLPVLVALWIAGLVLSSGRLWLRWRGAQRLIRGPFHAPAPPWKERFGQLARLAGVERIVRLGETAAVSVPVVAGWLKPVILLPLGVMMSLPAAQVEAVLLHELAHIARHDYLVNLLQNIVETLFFYHPAVWAVSRRIRLERELACDDRTIQWCRNPRTYAEALAGFEEFRGRPPLMAATGGGDLFNRIHRVPFGPQPERRSAGILCAAAFCGIGIYLASMLLAPVLAQDVMTAKERVAQIQALQQPSALDSSYGPGENVLVRGTIKTEDGKPLPKSLMEGQVMKQSEALLTSSRTGGWSGGGLNIDIPQDHKFYGNTRSGSITIGIWAEGYAPLRQTWFQTKKGEVNVDLLLKCGFPGRLQIIGSDGQPLKDALVLATSSHSGEPLNLSMPPVYTDAKGFATFGNVGRDSEIHLVVSKPGWQMADQVVSQWTDNAPLVWKLEHAISASGLVIDGVTRKPIPGAKVVLAARRGPGDSNYATFDPEKGQLLGTSDESGRFNLENLAENHGYYIYITAPGYPTQTFPIGYGEQGRICELTPGLHLHGKILDPKGLLSSKDLYHPIEIECMFMIQATPFNDYGQNQRQPLPKLGAEIPFSFDGLARGNTTIVFAVSGLRQYRYEIDLEKDIDDYVIDLGAKAPDDSSDKPDPWPLRTVEITLKTDSDASPTGSINGGYETTRNGKTWVTPKNFPIVAGRATIQLPVPSKMSLRADDIAGYWFAPRSFDVPEGTGPFTRTVELTAAGVIHGHVTLPQILKNGDLSISTIALKPPPGMTNVDFTGSYNRRLSEKNDYVTPPLPFGGTYAVVLERFPWFFVSAPALVDAGHPLVVRDFDVSATHDTLKGRFVDQTGKPVSYATVMLTYHPTEADAFVSQAATTGGDGSFTISNMNFSVPGNYEVQIFDGWEKTKIRIDGHTPQPVIIPLVK